jgi:hypothetical protein
MPREINLDGTEISIIKALGFGGGSVAGETLIERVPHLMEGEMIDSLRGLVMMGYIEVDQEGFQTIEDVEKASFHVNPGYSRDLRDAVNPSDRPKSKRVRRE